MTDAAKMRDDVAQRRAASLAKHHDRVQGATVLYPPKTPDAAAHWMETGVCPLCHRRAISGGECNNCGWEPPSRGES